MLAFVKFIFVLLPLSSKVLHILPIGRFYELLSLKLPDFSLRFGVLESSWNSDLHSFDFFLGRGKDSDGDGEWLLFI